MKTKVFKGKNKIIDKKMNYKKVLPLILISVLVLISSGICVAETKILFYETNKVSRDYKIETGYSKFKEALEDKGYSVSRIEIPLSREVLRSYDPDVLVIANLNSPLDASELAAIFEFVMQDGKGLFIAGGTSSANQITIPFGMTIDTGILEDESSPVWDSSSGAEVADKTNFVIHTINRQDPSIRLLIQGVNQLAFFGGNGISISGDAKLVVTGDWDTYSPKSPTFPKGSKPPVASAALVGNGLVFLLSDADMLTNDKIDTSRYRYDNLRFGINIIDWLRASKERPPKSVEIDELRIIVGQLMVDIDNLNRTKIALEKTIRERDKRIDELTQENSDKDEIIRMLQSQADPVLHINYTTWAILLLAIAIIALVAIMSKKAKKPEAEEEEEVGFGYEFEEGEARTGFEMGTEEFEDLMGMDKSKKK
ncbi:MAG: hypothetical protein DRO89_00510 [Candidatus Altiarchaeales archaeon]|nr:MAG: hypothetical protein DRO89_00510 [Candidatus Altiarchaeales archaeon]